MYSRSLIILSVAAMLSAIAASASFYEREDARPSPPAERVLDGRVYLTPKQSGETRNISLWPAQMRSLLNINHNLTYGEWVWDDRGVPAGTPTIRIDLGTQLISVARGGHEIGTAIILYGAEGHETPLGQFKILSKHANYRSRTYDAPMPFALRLTADGVSIHGSDVRPRSATHGCIGLPLEFAHRLFNQVDDGDDVLIVRT